MREPDGEKPAKGGADPKTDAQSAELRSRLDALKADLGEAIAEDRKRSDGAPDAHATGSQLGAGLRAATELVAGVLVGVAIGFLLDRQFGTKPLFLVIFLMLGMGAGFLNLYKLGMKRTDGGGHSGPGQNG